MWFLSSELCVLSYSFKSKAKENKPGFPKLTTHNSKLTAHH